MKKQQARKEIVVCTECGSSYDPHEKLKEGFRTHFGVGNLCFCHARCVLKHIAAHGLTPFAQVSHTQAFLEEEWEDGPEYRRWEHHGCTHCRIKEMDAQLIVISAPYDSTFPDEPWSVACSKDCLVTLFQKEEAWQATHQIGTWGEPLTT